MGSTAQRRRRADRERPDGHPGRRSSSRDASALLDLHGLVGNRAVERVLTGPVVHRCAPDRPDCDCGPQERVERALAARQRAPQPHRAAGGWMDPAASAAYRRGPWRAGPGDGSCGLEEEAGEEVAGAAREPAGRDAGHAHQPPLQGGGSATIVCDGSGGYRADLRGWSGAPCGIEGCVRRHELSHAADWKRRWPNGCKGKKDGDAIPLGGKGYAAFLKQSECTAYTVELRCIRNVIAKNKDKGCRKTLKDHRDDTRRQRRSYC